MVNKEEAKQEPVALETIYETIINWDEGGGKRSRRELAKRIFALTHPAPEAKQEPVVWMYQDKSTHSVSFQKHMRAFVDHGATYETPLYAHPAPVNTALLERAAQLACDAVAFNGGSVQMEAHVRAAIAKLKEVRGD